MTTAVKRASTTFLQTVIVLMGMGTLAAMLWLPLIEGRNANATLFAVYFNDPFLAYAYAASIAFYVALYQAVRLLGYAGRNEAFSPRTVNALRTVKYCALILTAFAAGAEAYFFIAQRGKDDIAGGVMMGLLVMFVSAGVAAVAATLERTAQNAVDMKSENDLTV